ncbi:hypothetical protein B0H13DRAFT_1905397 [Mycena leptocephala]|nr:hypothetical protein B0H13DRAFT_1905397 [Mycena leptocephala]
MDSTVSFDVNTTIGVLQISVLISYMLFGVTTTQTYIYYSRFPDDSPKLKALVAFVWVCEMAHALCVGHTLYVYTISDYAHPERLVGPAPVSLEAGVIFSGIIGAYIRDGNLLLCPTSPSTRVLLVPNLCFPEETIYLYSHLGYGVFALAGVHHHLRHSTAYALAAALREAVGVARHSHAERQRCERLGHRSDAGGLLHRRRTDVHKRGGSGLGVTANRRLLDKLIAWTIETGVMTRLAIFCINARLFSHSPLASLNSRTTLRAMDEVTVSVSLPSSTPTLFEPLLMRDQGYIALPQRPDYKNDVNGIQR